jgi:murein L,D-transpeptidase YafK
MISLGNVFLSFLLTSLCFTLGLGQANAKTGKKKPAANSAAKIIQDSTAETRLLEIYRQIGQGDAGVAFAQAERLVRDFPGFALAQLVYGDLLLAKTHPVKNFGSASPEQLGAAGTALSELKSEAQLRLKALRERPPVASVPTEFLQLAQRSKHAIAIDASRARLYLFENRAGVLTLVGDYYMSVGKLGTEKRSEGDLRTPLGVYFITSQLERKALKEFYGSGALPINYPNVLDIKRGKTGSGIWLHGTPPGHFSRPPQASDGCVVLSNPDLEHIMRTVEIRSTPVVISTKLKWVGVQQLQATKSSFEARLNDWLKVKANGNLEQLSTFYTADFNNNGKNWAQSLPALQREMQQLKGSSLELKDLSLLHWVDAQETMLVTFGEVQSGKRSGVVKRQYWIRQGQQWKLFYEGVTG